MGNAVTLRALVVATRIEMTFALTFGKSYQRYSCRLTRYRSFFEMFQASFDML